MPGTYKVRFTYGTAKDSTIVTVIDDPRYTFSKEEMAGREAVREFIKNEVYKRMNAAHTAFTRLNEAKTTAENIGKAIPMDRRDSAAVKLRNEAKAMQDSLKAILNLFLQDNSDKQGIVRTSDDITNAIITVLRVAASGRTQVPTTATEQLVVADKKLAEGLARVNGFFDVSWKKFQENWKAANLTPFKEYKPIEIK
jgi:signal-transduction protein with cAMP-binding, CBS, and nucleotidyltransferase domain